MAMITRRVKNIAYTILAQSLSEASFSSQTLSKKVLKIENHAIKRAISIGAAIICTHGMGCIILSVIIQSDIPEESQLNLSMTKDISIRSEIKRKQNNSVFFIRFLIFLVMNGFTNNIKEDKNDDN